MNTFSIQHDFKQVLWGPTIVHNLLRAFCAGLVWAVLMIVFEKSPEYPVWQKLILPLVWPIGYLVGYLPLGLLANALVKMGVPFARWIAIFFSITIIVGDPLVYILDKLRPDLVPVENPRILNFTMIVFVVKPAAIALQ